MGDLRKTVFEITRARQFAEKLARAAACRSDASPFDQGDVAAVREAFLSFCSGSPVAGPLDAIPDGQCFPLFLVEAFAHRCWDPDAHAVQGYVSGNRLGVDCDMPRTPLIWEEKVRWSRGPPEGTVEMAMSNYRSAELSRSALEKIVYKDVARGFISPAVPRPEVIAKFGERVAICAVRAVPKDDGPDGDHRDLQPDGTVAGDQVRLILDGSNGVQVNHRIKVRDQVTCPGAGEVKTVMARAYRRERRYRQAKLDVSSAHQRCKVAAEDHALQAFELEPGQTFLNKVGTFGVASAAYHWARLFAIILRGCHYFMGAIDWFALVYVDDLKVDFLEAAFWDMLSVVVAYFLAMGVPFSWKKFEVSGAGGGPLLWVGYAIDYARFTVGITEKRASWCVNWIDALLHAGRIELRALESFVGKLMWVSTALDTLRPFLQPLYAWVHCGAPKSVPLSLPEAVRFALTFWRSALVEGPGEVPSAAWSRSSTRLLGDAKADVNSVRVGGFELLGDAGPLSKCRWFSEEVTPSNAPWAFARQGLAQRCIGALELLTSLLLVVAFGPQGPGASVVLPGVTDNQGNSYIVARLFTMQHPSAAILMELAAQFRSRGVALDLEWRRRDRNQDADDLTECRFDNFSSALRVRLDISSMPWLVLNEMLVAGSLLAEARATTKSGQLDTVACCLVAPSVWWIFRQLDSLRYCLRIHNLSCNSSKSRRRQHKCILCIICAACVHDLCFEAFDAWSCPLAHILTTIVW